MNTTGTLHLSRPAALDLIGLLVEAVAESPVGDTTLTFTLKPDEDRAVLTVDDRNPSVYVSLTD